MPRPNNFFTHLNGIRVQYDRPPLGTYGKTGKNYKFYCVQDFEDELDAFVASVRSATEPLLGPLQKIFSAGAYVKKSKLHGVGRAFDLDALIWERETLTGKDQPRKKPLYLLIQAIAYQHFGMVLAYNYNTAHEDHFHLDNSRAVEFRETKAATYFMQEALNLFFGASLEIDGDYGPNTEDALTDAFEPLGLSFPPKVSDWKKFLKAIEGEALDFLNLQDDQAEPASADEDDDDFDGSPPAPEPSDESVTGMMPALAPRTDIGRIDLTYQPEPGWGVARTNSSPVKWHLKRSGKPDLYLGYDFKFGNYRGLARTGRIADSEFFDYRDFEDEHGLWAAFLTPTAMCESESNFFVVNAWDSAAMTLGFFQMAAHTGKHLADLFRDLIEELPHEADVYFPELKLGTQLGLGGHQARRLYAVNNGDTLDLDEKTRHPDGLHFRSYDRGRFMAFFNPHRGKLDEHEVVSAARWIAWLQASMNARKVIVRNAVATSKRAVEDIHKLVKDSDLANLPNGLHGVSMAIVQAAMDVKHHGRRNRDKGWSTNRTILHALSLNEPLKSFRYVDTGWREDRSKRSVSEIGKMSAVYSGKTLNTSTMTFE